MDGESYRLEKWRLNWDLVDVLIGGKSPIDMASLDIKDRNDAVKFLHSYGYSSESDVDRKLIHAGIVEALSFIQTVLMPKEWAKGKVAPEEILRCTDVIDLLVYASVVPSTPRERLIGYWACAVLRLMHTIGHIQGLEKFADVSEARNQIISKFQKHLFRERNGNLLLGDEVDSVELERVEWKTTKSRQSIILKLLHKPANVSETIYDFIGVRIITKSLVDVVQVVKILGQKYIVSFPNTNPGRARNSLIDLSSFKTSIAHLTSSLAGGQITVEEFDHKLRNLELAQDSVQRTNPHSGQSYRSVQMTCRQLVKYNNPLNRWAEKSRSFLNDFPMSEKSHQILSEAFSYSDSWLKVFENENSLNVFFPFEVQIFDANTRTLIEQSESNHTVYKKSQIRTARKRVLGDVLKFYRTSKGS